jgi:hypothetical protein
MVPDPIADVLRELLVHQVAGWAPAALQRSRRATFVYAYGGVGAGAAEAVLRVFVDLAEPSRGHRLTVVVLVAQPGDLATRLGTGQAGLPAEVSVHLVPGAVDRLPVALKAAGAAGAPVLAVVDAAHGPAPDPAALAAVATGRPAELLLVLGGPARAERDHRQALSEAGFPLVADVELAGVPDTEPQLLVFGTSSGKRLEAFKDGIWAVGGDAGVRYRDPRHPERLLDITPSPALDPLGRELLARLARVGRCSVSELRQFTVAQTVYRVVDANQVLAELLAAGLVTRDPASGRLGGDVLIESVPPAPGQPPEAARPAD